MDKLSIKLIKSLPNRPEDTLERYNRHIQHKRISGRQINPHAWESTTKICIDKHQYLRVWRRHNRSNFPFSLCFTLTQVASILGFNFLIVLFGVAIAKRFVIPMFLSIFSATISESLAVCALAGLSGYSGIQICFKMAYDLPSDYILNRDILFSRQLQHQKMPQQQLPCQLAAIIRKRLLQRALDKYIRQHTEAYSITHAKDKVWCEDSAYVLHKKVGVECTLHNYFISYKRARGPKKHLKRLAASKTWMLNKLGGVFARRPSTGPHKLRESLPLMIFLSSRLKTNFVALVDYLQLESFKFVQLIAMIDTPISYK
uniref:40S ribosomal protein S4 n=1 Tax=Glossina austeni TaxID=7395 RepID=A0A1A9VTX1_GLOAU